MGSSISPLLSALSAIIGSIMPVSHLRKQSLTVIFCCISSIIPFISLLVRIPEYVNFICIILIILLFVSCCRSFNGKWKTLTSAIAAASILWLMWSSICWPFWNSEFLSGNWGMPFEYTQSPDKMISRKDAKKDLHFAYKNICKTHPKLKDSIPQPFKEAFSFANGQIDSSDSISVIGLYAVIQTMAATLHDAHTNVFPRFKELNQIDLEQYGNLISVNDMTADSIFIQSRHLYSSETDDFSHLLMLNYLSLYEYLPLFNLDIDSGIRCSFSNAQGDTVQYIFHKNDYFANRYELPDVRSQTDVSSYAIYDSLDCGYFDIHHFECFLPGKMKAVKSEISSFFDDLTEKHIGNVIFDVRNNTGGNPKVWHCIINHLTGKHVSYGNGSVRCGPFEFNYKLGFNCSKDIRNIYDGNVFILTSTLSFSAAMEFAYCLQSNGLGKIIGLSPGNTPNCHTSVFTYCLPESGLRIQVSNHTHVADWPGLVNNRIVPDYECPSEEAFVKALEIIRSQKN